MTTYQNKDGHRIWWKITVEKTNSTNDARAKAEEHNDLDYYWDVNLYLDDKLIFSDAILGQYDNEPSLLNVVNFLSQFFVGGLLNMAKYGDK